MRAIIQCIWIGIGFMYSWDHYKQKLHDKYDYIYTYTYLFFLRTHTYIYIYINTEREIYLIYIYYIQNSHPLLAAYIQKSRPYGTQSSCSASPWPPVGPRFLAFRSGENVGRKWCSDVGFLWIYIMIYMDLYNDDMDLYLFIFIYMDLYGFIYCQPRLRLNHGLLN
jgi:hypothetical protein